MESLKVYENAMHCKKNKEAQKFNLVRASGARLPSNVTMSKPDRSPLGLRNSSV